MLAVLADLILPFSRLKCAADRADQGDDPYRALEHGHGPAPLHCGGDPRRICAGPRQHQQRYVGPIWLIGKVARKFVIARGTESFLDNEDSTRAFTYLFANVI